MSRYIVMAIISTLLVIGSYSKTLLASELVNHVSQSHSEHSHGHSHGHTHHHEHSKSSKKTTKSGHNHNYELSTLTLSVDVPSSPTFTALAVFNSTFITLSVEHPSLNTSDYPTSVFRPPIA